MEGWSDGVKRVEKHAFGSSPKAALERRNEPPAARIGEGLRHVDSHCGWIDACVEQADVRDSFAVGPVSSSCQKEQEMTNEWRRWKPRNAPARKTRLEIVSPTGSERTIGGLEPNRETEIARFEEGSWMVRNDSDLTICLWKERNGRRAIDSVGYQDTIPLAFLSTGEKKEFPIESPFPEEKGMEPWRLYAMPCPSAQKLNRSDPAMAGYPKEDSLSNPSNRVISALGVFRIALD